LLRPARRSVADDQAICAGYANNLPQTNHLPVAHRLAGRIARRLYALRLEAFELDLGPDSIQCIFLNRRSSLRIGAGNPSNMPGSAPVARPARHRGRRSVRC